MDKQSVIDIRNNFHKIYYEKILPQLQNLEYLRKIFLLKMILYVSLVLAVMVLGFCFQQYLNDFAVFIEVIGLLSIVFIVYFSNNFFIDKLKNHCMRNFLNSFGNMYWQTNPISDVELNKSGLFSDFNKRTNDDGFVGSYNDVKFLIDETDFGVETHGKHRSYREIFNGVIIQFDSNKNILGKTIIATKGDSNLKGRSAISTIKFMAIGGIFACVNLSIKYNRFDWLSVYITIGICSFIFIIALISDLCIQKKENLHKIELEDPEFNRKFNVYSEDEIEARYLVTTSFMERILHLKTAFVAKMVKCSFYSNKIMFAISTRKNLFEIGNLFHKLSNPKQIQKAFEEMLSILLMIEYFRFNQKIGL